MVIKVHPCMSSLEQLGVDQHLIMEAQIMVSHVSTQSDHWISQGTTCMVPRIDLSSEIIRRLSKSEACMRTRFVSTSYWLKCPYYFQCSIVIRKLKLSNNFLAQQNYTSINQMYITEVGIGSLVPRPFPSLSMLHAESHAYVEKIREPWGRGQTLVSHSTSQ